MIIIIIIIIIIIVIIIIQAREINNYKELTILRLRNASRKECWTVVFGEGTGPLINILLSWIHWLSSPDLISGMCSW